MSIKPVRSRHYEGNSLLGEGEVKLDGHSLFGTGGSDTRDGLSLFGKGVGNTYEGLSLRGEGVINTHEGLSLPGEYGSNL